MINRVYSPLSVIRRRSIKRPSIVSHTKIINFYHSQKEKQKIFTFSPLTSQVFTFFKEKERPETYF